MSEFTDALSFLKGFASKTFAGARTNFDQVTYQALVDCLKDEDPICVKTAIDQLAAEGKLLAVPPLYLVFRAHPVLWVRKQAAKALEKLVKYEQLNPLVEKKDLKGAIEALVAQYGNYRAPSA